MSAEGKTFVFNACLCLAVEEDKTPLKLAIDSVMTSDDNFCESTEEQRDLRCLR